jgi:hypothetical protein
MACEPIFLPHKNVLEFIENGWEFIPLLHATDEKRCNICLPSSARPDLSFYVTLLPISNGEIALLGL